MLVTNCLMFFTQGPSYFLVVFFLPVSNMWCFVLQHKNSFLSLVFTLLVGYKVVLVAKWVFLKLFNSACRFEWEEKCMLNHLVQANFLKDFYFSEVACFQGL